MDEVRRLSELARRAPSVKLLENLFSCGRSSTALSLALSIAEKVLFSLLEESNFGREPLPASSVSLLRETVVSLLEMKPPIDEGGVWFGGGSKCVVGTGKREKWSAALLVGCTLLRDDNLTFSSAELIEKYYRNTAEFVFYMSGQDDRLLSVLLALLLQKHSLKGNRLLKPSFVCLHAFSTFSFQYEVVLDWLNSDLVSLPFFTRFLEDITENLETWQENAEQVQKTRESVQEMSFMPGNWVEEQAEPSGDDVVLRLRELAGSQLVEKEMRISRREPRRTWVPWQPEPFDEPLFSKLYDMLVRLRLRLEALEAKSLGNYPTLVRLLEKFEDLVDEDDGVEEYEEEEEYSMESDA